MSFTIDFMEFDGDPYIHISNGDIGVNYWVSDTQDVADALRSYLEENFPNILSE